MAVVPQPVGGELILYSSTQIPHILKVMTAVTTGFAEHKLRVIAPAVGGGFGSKLDVYAEELIAVAVARKLGVPVRWTEERSENARRHRPGPRPDPGHRARRRRRRQDHRGAREAARRHGGVPAAGHARHPAARRVPLPRRLRHPAVLVRVHGRVHEQDADRRVPRRGPARRRRTRSSAAIDALAAKVGVAPTRSAAATSSSPTQFPYTSSAGPACSTPATTSPTLDRALELVGYDAVREEQADRRSTGADEAPRHRHLVLRRDVRARPVPRARVAELRRRRLGVGHGAGPADRQGAGRHRHRAARAGPRDELVDDRRRQVRRRRRTTSRCCTPTPRSRRWASTPTGRARCPSAASRSTWRRRRCSTRRATIAAHQMEATEDDLEFVDGEFRVRGHADQGDADPGHRVRGVHRARPARRHGAEPQPRPSPTTRRTSRSRSAPTSRWSRSTRRPAACGCCDYAAVDDCGNQVNPLIVDRPAARRHRAGRRAGAVGGGGVRRGRAAPQRRRLIDYLVPSAAEVPSFKLDHTVTPSPDERARREGHRRGRHDRGDAGGDQRRRRRAVASRHHRRRDAGVAATAVDAHPGGEVADDPCQLRLRAGRVSRSRRRSCCSEHGDDAKLLAGGHSLLPLMKLRLATPSVLVDVGRLRDLSYVRDGGDHVAVGALTRHHDLEHSDLLGSEVPLLRHAAGQVGDPQVRHRGTIGGSVAHGDPGVRPSRRAARAAGDAGRAGPERHARDRASTTSSRASSRPRSRPTSCSPRSGCRRPAARAGRSRSSTGARRTGRSSASPACATAARASASSTWARRRCGVRRSRTRLRSGASIEDAAAVADRGHRSARPTSTRRPEYRRHLARVLVRRALEQAGG